MRHSFHPRLINGPFEDPGLFIPFLFQNRAIIFDLGDTGCLTARQLLKISHAFVTHTHMDHFIGFDRLLRLFLGRDKHLTLFGPPGFLRNVQGKLSAYAWNLVDNFNYHLTLQAIEIHQQHTLSGRFLCQDGFKPNAEAVSRPFDGVVHAEPGFTVSAALLDHGIPCLGFAFQEDFHVNIIKEGLKQLGLAPGPWLTRFKQSLYRRDEPDEQFDVVNNEHTPVVRFRLGELADKIARITPGQKISYITDVVYSPTNAERIVALVENSDQLFIEAVFLNAQTDLAARKKHLTASQAGRIAAMAGVKQFTVFHFSPRYTGQGHLLMEEATTAYMKRKNGSSPI